MVDVSENRRRAGKRDILDNALGYRPDAACAMLGVGKTKIFEMIRTGQVDSVLIGRTRIITAQSIRDLLHGKAA